ncbi:ribosomal protein S10p/S20e [Teladorsagia circumcincta]|uniref:Ribosomal protein S10p/S20e n=1 Tax=Teladorsagia circumcincta TaxID=45464 RepID=A0A2G9TPL4_TELCI|nr:ribosomal protein S10p/S20e [Teladorsagia circumcincta]
MKDSLSIPTKVLGITTRKTPWGEESKTWDRFKMGIHEPLINLHTPADLLRQITSISVANPVSMLRSLRVTETSPEMD